MADLTTVAAVKQWLGVGANAAAGSTASTIDDTLLAALVSGVSAWIQNWLERQILSAPYTKTVNGNGKQTLFLANTPITAVTALVVDGVSIPARTSVTGSGYTFDDDAIYLVNYCFTRGVQNVQLGYTGGLASVPADLDLAAKKLVGMSYRERDRIGLSSKGLATEQTNFIITDLPKDVQNILWQYRRVTAAAA